MLTNTQKYLTATRKFLTATRKFLTAIIRMFVYYSCCPLEYTRTVPALVNVTPGPKELQREPACYCEQVKNQQELKEEQQLKPNCLSLQLTYKCDDKQPNQLLPEKLQAMQVT